MKSQFDAIVTYLLDADRTALKNQTFEELCCSFNVSSRRMNHCFYDCFGMSGDEAIQNIGLFY